jgi:hypothetical protein
MRFWRGAVKCNSNIVGIGGEPDVRHNEPKVPSQNKGWAEWNNLPISEQLNRIKNICEVLGVDELPVYHSSWLVENRKVYK